MLSGTPEKNGTNEQNIEIARAKYNLASFFALHPKTATSNGRFPGFVENISVPQKDICIAEMVGERSGYIFGYSTQQTRRRVHEGLLGYRSQS